jgi:LPXTG-site transpeptidase (sortase) family protein
VGLNQLVIVVVSMLTAAFTAVAAGGIDQRLPPGGHATPLAVSAASTIPDLSGEAAFFADEQRLLRRPATRATTLAIRQSVVIIPTAVIDGTSPMGRLTIPKLQLRSAPVFNRGLDASGNMEIAPGFAITHYAHSSTPGAPGNSVLYGHDDIDGSIFRYLHNLQPGDLIYFDGAGRTTFRVTGKTIVTPDRVDILNDSTTPRLTLFTCYPYWVDTHRLVVFAEPA